MKKITIKDVAREAGVSTATVSNALNNSDVVQPKTREHVLAVAQRMGYIPNVNGKRLRTMQSKTIGLFVTAMTGDYYGNMADAIHYVCRRHDYELNVFIVSDAESILQKLHNHIVDGAIVFCGPMDENTLKRIDAADCPVVFLDQEKCGPKVSSVLFDSFTHGGMAADYLLGLGHRDLMHVYGLRGNYDSDQREAGFFSALKCAGVSFREENLLEGRFERAAAYREMRRYLQEGHKLPDAIFASNDLSATGCMEALKENGVRIPEDISIISCDDNILCSLVTPNLTTIRTNTPKMGTKAAEEIFRLIAQGNGRIIRLPGSIIVRHSCCVNPTLSNPID